MINLCSVEKAPRKMWFVDPEYIIVNLSICYIWNEFIKFFENGTPVQ